MNDWQQIDRQRRINIIETISKETNLSPAAIEKDWWVFIIEKWRNDYSFMQANMIYGASLPFGKLIERIKELNGRFRKISVP